MCFLNAALCFAAPRLDVACPLVAYFAVVAGGTNPCYHSLERPVFVQCELNRHCSTVTPDTSPPCTVSTASVCYR